MSFWVPIIIDYDNWHGLGAINSIALFFFVFVGPDAFTRKKKKTNKKHEEKIQKKKKKITARACGWQLYFFCLLMGTFLDQLMFARACWAIAGRKQSPSHIDGRCRVLRARRLPPPAWCTIFFLRYASSRCSPTMHSSASSYHASKTPESAAAAPEKLQNSSAPVRLSRSDQRVTWEA